MKLFYFLSLSIVLLGCNANSSRNQFNLAEKLFLEGRYEAAIHEYDKIVKRYPKDKLGMDALMKKGTIQELYLSDPVGALNSYRLLMKRSKDKALSQKIEEKVATMYFEKFEDFRKAAKSYRNLIRKNKMGKRSDYYFFRLAKSNYLLSRFQSSINILQSLKKNFPKSEYFHKATYEIGNAYNSKGECKKALKFYEMARNEARAKKLRSLAIFGKASCLEELNNLDQAYDLLASIRSDYPTPSVIKLKMMKIKRRKILRQR